MRSMRLRQLLKKTMTSNTSPASIRLRMLPNEPSATAELPPPQADTPTLMRHSPMSVTTMPYTTGVIIRRAYRSMHPTITSMNEAAMHVPNITAGPPAIPAAITGPMNE